MLPSIAVVWFLFACKYVIKLHVKTMASFNSTWLAWVYVSAPFLRIQIFCHIVILFIIIITQCCYFVRAHAQK